MEAESLTRANRPPIWGDDARILDRIGDSAPVVLVINKIDQLGRRHDLLPVLQTLQQDFNFAEIIPVSATKGTNVERLIDVLLDGVSEGDMLYPVDVVSDRAERFVAAEIIREHVLRQTRDEIPYATAVEIEEFVEAPDGLHLKATIHVERESQKGVIIGKGGTRLREIGTAARMDLETFFEIRVDLRTLVRVEADWSLRPEGLRRFGYGEGEI